MIWHLKDIRGTRDAVKAAVNASNAPAEVKAYVCYKVDALPPETIACRLDGFCQDTESKTNLTLTMREDITLVAIKV